MNSKQLEILDILQEECGELIVAISKVKRFGIDNTYKEGGTQRAHLTQEAGDVLRMIQLLTAHGVISAAEVEDASTRKAEKLKQWSSIYA